MANKPEFVDLISDATRQKRRRREETHVVAKTVFDEPEEAPQPERRLSNWPPGRIAQGAVMANKPEFVDLISDATRQKRRRREETHIVAKTVFDEPEEAPQPERRLSNWPPGRIAQWRMENLSAWKMKVKGWKFKDWT